MCLYFSSNPSYEKELTLEDLRSKTTEISNVTMKEKKEVRIAILDDMGFDRERLNKLGFKDVRLFEKFEDLSDFEGYDIVLCDINGIGVDYDETYQGVSIAKMIKNTYPNKIVVVYSAAKHDAEINRYIKEADIDDYINKNISKADLNDKLNEYIMKLNDPITIWERTRVKLYQHDFSPKKIALMEHYYVKSFLKNKDYSSKITSINNNVSPELIKGLLGVALNILNFYLSKRIGG